MERLPIVWVCLPVSDVARSRSGRGQCEDNQEVLSRHPKWLLPPAHTLNRCAQTIGIMKRIPFIQRLRTLVYTMRRSGVAGTAVVMRVSGVITREYCQLRVGCSLTAEST